MNIHSAETTLRFAVGDIALTKVVELVEHANPGVLYVDKTPDDFDPHLHWLQPNYVDAEKSMLLSVHSFVLQTTHHTILVDTCVGNHKKGHSRFPQWNGRDGRYLDDLAAAGVAPEDVDFVMCTHMHSDHTGWNTRLKDGRWVPTFPNATYLFDRGEWQAWKDDDSETVRENILPILEAKQEQWVNGDLEIDGAVSLMPTPGHTPGHCSVVLKSNREQAVITGDMMIHPVQIAEPDWRQRGDSDKELAINTRTHFIDQHCDRDVLILGSHFDSPTGVHIVSKHGERRIHYRKAKQVNSSTI